MKILPTLIVLFFSASLKGQGEVSTDSSYQKGVYMGLSISVKPQSHYYSFSNKYALETASYDPKVSGFNFYNIFIPGFNVSLIQKRNLHHGFNLRYALSKRNGKTNVFSEYKYHHTTVSYSFEYLLMKSSPFKSPYLKPFFGANSFISFFHYYYEFKVDDYHYERFTENIFSTSLQASIGLKYNYKRILMELALDYNIVGYMNGNKIWEIKDESYNGELYENSGIDKLSSAIFIEELGQNNVFLHSVTIKVAYKL